MTPLDSPAGAALLRVLRCPACSGQDWSLEPARVTCRECGRAHPIVNGILQIDLAAPHPEVQQERASVPATEMRPELGGWREAYTPETDPSSSLAQAYLSLPYGNDSAHFEEPGYFQNVRRFAPEFDFVVRRLPPRGLLLDVGADGTWSTAQLARRGLTCIALDITHHLTLAHLFQTAAPPYALINVDMHEPVFAEAAFDAITAFNALHHSKRLDTLARTLARSLTPGGVLGFVEPYVQNADQEAAFGAPQTELGINENVHTIERWHHAFTTAGLTLEAYALSDSFNAIFRRTRADEGHGDVRRDFYDAELTVAPASARLRAGRAGTFQVTVRSRGRAAWASRGPLPVRLSYHLSARADGRLEMVRFDNERTLLPDFVGAEPVTFTVPVTLHEPGDYVLEFDLVHETRSWFKDRGGRTATAHVTVGHSAAAQRANSNT